MDAWQIPSEQFYFIYLAIEVVLFLFVCELFIVNFFFFFFVNLGGFFFFCYPLFFLCFCLFVCLFVCLFLLYFALFFVGLGGLGLPCHLLCCFLLIVYLFIYFIFIYLFFFYPHGFSGFIFFVSLIALGTSSLRLIVFPLGGWLHGGPVSGTGIEG